MELPDWIAREERIQQGLASVPESVHSNATDCADSDPPRLETLRTLGIYTADTLQEAVKFHARRPELIQGLIRSRSVNLLVGDSGLGKTPLAIQIGLSVASGVPLFGLQIADPGPVLYCDAESDLSSFSEMVVSISRFLGLEALPRDFHVWSPNWETRLNMSEAMSSASDRVITRAQVVEPKLVIVDPLRMFWPHGEKGSEEAVATVDSMRKASRPTGCTWLLIHHRRKVNQQLAVARLQEDPQGWFQEAAGSHALVNQTDTRIGVVPHSGEADLLLAGFVRGAGPLVPLDLARVLDADGNPEGYRLLTGLEHLSAEDRGVFVKLNATFRFKDVLAAMGGRSDSNANRFVKRCRSLDVIRKDAPNTLRQLRLWSGWSVWSDQGHSLQILHQLHA
jgi:hypothetical protein